MPKRIFISATNTDIGKTYTTKLLLQKFTQLGYNVGVMKPMETGVSETPEDAATLYALTCKLNPKFANVGLENVVPITYTLAASPYVASENAPLDIQKIDAALQKIEQFCDLVLIEGAGGLLVPIDTDYFMVDLARKFDAKVLLVTHCSLGCINDTLLNLKLLNDYGLEHTFVFNCKGEEEDFKHISKKYFDDAYKEVFLLSEDIDALAHTLLVPLSKKMS
jgi:dethiobiotin synthetase